MTRLEMKRSPRRSRGRPSAAALRGPVRLDRAGHEHEQRGHVPVLASELLDLLDLKPGQTALDCTFGDGGHARLVAERLGSIRTLVAIDRAPLAQERFDALREELPCSARFIRAGYA